MLTYDHTAVKLTYETLFSHHLLTVIIRTLVEQRYNFS